MNKELVELLRDAFGAVGIGAEYAMGELSSYYFAYAVVTIVASLLVGVLLAAWGRTVLRQAGEQRERPTGYAGDWAGSVVANVVGYVVASTVYATSVLFGVLPAAIAAIVSPEGYVLQRVLKALGGTP